LPSAAGRISNPLANSVGSGMWAVAIAKVKLTVIYVTIGPRRSQIQAIAHSFSGGPMRTASAGIDYRFVGGGYPGNVHGVFGQTERRELSLFCEIRR
jgi:hypothetical protein